MDSEKRYNFLLYLRHKKKAMDYVHSLADYYEILQLILKFLHFDFL